MSKVVEIPVLTVKNQAGLFTFDLTEAPDEFVLQALQHGLKQKLGDAWSTAKNTDGTPGTIAVRTAAVAKVAEQLKTWQWSKRLSEGERLDLYEQCLRSVLSDQFFKAGMKRVEADKASRDSKTRAELYRDTVIKPQLMRVAPDREHELDQVAGNNWTKVTMVAKEQAAKIAAARDESNIDVEL